MKQRARLAGVLANPFRFIEAGQEFEHAELMNWAAPVEEPPADEAAEPEHGAQAPEQEVKAKRGRKPAAEPEPSDPI
ncbi:MAG: hypothetical protein RJA36_898 [Pseudomonadota bacterium]|jgi:hypothetical protein